MSDFGSLERPKLPIEIPDMVFMVLDIMNASPLQAIGVCAFSLYFVLLVIFLQRNSWRIDNNPEV